MGSECAGASVHFWECYKCYKCVHVRVGVRVLHLCAPPHATPQTSTPPLLQPTNDTPPPAAPLYPPEVLGSPGAHLARLRAPAQRVGHVDGVDLGDVVVEAGGAAPPGGRLGVRVAPARAHPAALLEGPVEDHLLALRDLVPESDREMCVSQQAVDLRGGRNSGWVGVPQPRSVRLRFEYALQIRQVLLLEMKRFTLLET